MTHTKNGMFLTAVIACIGLVLVGGCRQAEQTESGNRIAVVISTLNNPWFVVLGETAKQRAEELGYEVTIFDSQDDTAREKTHFENIIAQGYKAILFNPTDADASVASVEDAKEAGIPVFCMDREINSTDAAVSQMLSDNYVGCEQLGQYFVQTVKQGKYIELLGLPGDNNTHNRSKGFHSVVDRYPELRMVAQQTANFDRADAMDVTETLLRSHGDVVAIFCGNDAMAMGAYRALETAGKADQVMVFGFDGAEDAILSIQAGGVQATVMQFPKLMARTAAESADAYIRGTRDFPRKQPVAVELVTPENVAKYAPYGKNEDVE